MLKSLRDFAVVFVVIIAIGTAVDWFAAGPGGSRPSPSPPVPPRPEVVTGDLTARKAITTYAQTLASSFNEAAGKLETGEITTADQLSKTLSVMKDAKSKLLVPVYQRMNAEYGKEKWDPAKAAKLLRALSAGMKDLQ